jgi:hypothetical protein
MDYNILTLVFLMAGTLLTTTAVSTMIPAAYAANDIEVEEEQPTCTESLLMPG